MAQYHTLANALKDKVILVTGASAGIGYQAALTYAQYGATVILHGRNQEKLRQVYNDIVAGGYSTPAIITLDLKAATKSDYIEVAETLRHKFGQLDGLLHSAGILGGLTPFADIEESVFDAALQINVKAELLLTQALLPLLQRSPAGRIIFTSSTVGHVGRALWGSYAISKFAVEGMMQTLADEVKTTPLRVNAINPGATRTAMRAQAAPDEDPNILKTPLDIMPVYLHLMDPAMQDIHGQCIDAQPKK